MLYTDAGHDDILRKYSFTQFIYEIVYEEDKYNLLTFFFICYLEE